MRSCIIVKHLLRETGASTEKNDLPDRAAARIAPEARVQKKRVLVLSAPQTVRAGEANRAVGAVFAIATCESLAPSVKCAMKDAGVNPLAPSMRCAAKGASANPLVRHVVILKAETAPVAVLVIPRLAAAAVHASAKCMWARAIVVSAPAEVRALTHRGWPIVPLLPLCLLLRLRPSCA